jgi:SAM-dependent MidA family methyltransferase
MRPTPLSKILLERIAARGPLTFAEYMEECLYQPQHGYYARPDHGPRADYQTSVDVHPIFARLLVRQLAEMWEALGRPEEFTVVEAGAGTGRLAAHILDFAARARPDFFRTLRYVAVERSAVCRAAIQEAITAAQFPTSRATVAELVPEKIAAGCIFSNELLDAMPVHRVVRKHGELSEIFVDAGGNALGEVVRPLSSERVRNYFAEQRVELGEGQHAEAGLAACSWVSRCFDRLTRGFMLTIDYGYEAAELYSRRHWRGTVMAYENHRASEDYYAAPGEQDLTAHVNFSALQSPPVQTRQVRPVNTGLVSQTRFLLNLGRANDFADLYEEGQNEAERFRAREGLKTLIHPEGMGETFKVLIQHIGVDAPRLTGLQQL